MAGRQAERVGAVSATVLSRASGRSLTWWRRLPPRLYIDWDLMIPLTARDHRKVRLR